MKTLFLTSSASVPLLMEPAAHSAFVASVDALNARAARAAEVRAESFREYCEGLAEKAAGLQVVGNGIGYQPVRGVMRAGCHPYWELDGTAFNTYRIAAACEAAKKDAAMRALVLDFDSPGGSSAGVEDAYLSLLELRAARPDLPVLGYVSGGCHSAAVWVAAGTHGLHASRTARVGSVGAYIWALDSSAAYAAAGLKVIFITDGTFKGLGEDGVEWPDEWAKHLQESVATVGSAFKTAVQSFAPLMGAEDMQGQSFDALALSRAGRVGPGHLLASVPGANGSGGHRNVGDFLSFLSAAL